MIGGQPVPVDPKLLLMANPMGGVQVPTTPAAAAGIGQPQSTGIPSGTITSTTTTGASSGGSAMPYTEKVKEADVAQTAASGLAQDARNRMASLRTAESTFRSEQADREAANEAAKAQERQVLKEQHDARVASALAELETRQKERANLKPSTYIEDMGLMRRAIMAIGIGLGQYQSGMTGGPNTAFQIFQAGESSHRAKQQAEIEKAAQAVEMAGGNLKIADEMRRKAYNELDEKYLLRNQYLQKQIEAKIKRIPYAAAEGQADIAKLKADEAKAKMDVAQRTAGTKTWEGPKTSTTIVEGKPEGGSGGQAPRETINELAATRMQIKALDERDKIIAKNPRAWEAYREAVKAQDEAEIAKGTKLGGMLITSGQGLGYVAMGVDQRLQQIKDPRVRADAKRLNQLDPIVQTAQARISDPIGVLNEAAQVNARKTMNIYTATPDEARNLGKQFREQFVERESLLSAGAPVRKAEAVAERKRTSQEPRPQPASTTQSQPRNSATPDRDYKAIRSDIVQAKRILANPNASAAEKAAAKRFLAGGVQ